MTGLHHYSVDGEVIEIKTAKKGKSWIAYCTYKGEHLQETASAEQEAVSRIKSIIEYCSRE